MTETQVAPINARIAETIVIPTSRRKPEMPGMLKVEEHEAWPVLSRLSIPVSMEINMAGFKVRDLLALENGRLIESSWAETEDVRVKAGGIQVGWSEFEVEDQRLMVRLTRLV